jgi:hypothetical protein
MGIKSRNIHQNLKRFAGMEHYHDGNAREESFVRPWQLSIHQAARVKRLFDSVCKPFAEDLNQCPTMLSPTR